MATKRLVVLDFDGTLFFTDVPVSMAAKELLGKPMAVSSVRKLSKSVKGKVYDLAFSKYTSKSRPNLLLINKIARQGPDHRIIVLTKRGDRRKPQTWDLIKANGIKFVEGIYSTDNFDIGDEQWKLQKMRAYLKKYQRISLYEDKKENIDYIKARLSSPKVSYYLVSRRQIKRIR